MAIPDYQSIMLPLLNIASDREEHSLREAINSLAKEFKLTEEEKKELLPSGKQAKFDNRVGWARTYLEKAGLLKKPRRAHFIITERGIDVLQSKPDSINTQFLEQFDEFISFRQLRHEPDKSKTQKETSLIDTPEEALESAHLALKNELISEIIQSIKQCNAEFFEKLVVDLLVKMGYGGSRREAGQAMGKSGDEGIDGIIKEDRLGLDIIYIQAKRWEGSVGRPEIQKFAGALQGQRAKKGIFLTTSEFTKDAENYVSNIDPKIILINGLRIAELMIEHNVGVTPVTNYEIKRLDTDYFIEE